MSIIFVARKITKICKKELSANANGDQRNNSIAIKMCSTRVSSQSAVIGGSNKSCDMHHANNGNQSIRFFESRHFQSNYVLKRSVRTIVDEITFAYLRQFDVNFIGYLYTAPKKQHSRECFLFAMKSQAISVFREMCVLRFGFWLWFHFALFRYR